VFSFDWYPDGFSRRRAGYPIRTLMWALALLIALIATLILYERVEWFRLNGAPMGTDPAVQQMLDYAKVHANDPRRDTDVDEP
jgi:hypothetical protein